MKLQYYDFDLRLKHEFKISYNTRNSTPDVIIKIEQDGICGFGEASLPPYLPENKKTVIDFLSKIKLDKIKSYQDVEKILAKIDSADEGNTAAKAAIDIALHDLIGKLENEPCYMLYNISKTELPFTSFTIGIDEPEVMRKKIKEAEEYKILKIKLGTENDKNIISLIRSETDKPLYADVNQGWKDESYALEMSYWLAEQNVLLIEQPFNKNDLASSAYLSERSPIPIIADESVQRFSDMEKINGAFNGINIKLMKCTGVAEAYRMILKARELGMKIMLGCMTETSCAISAAVHLSSLADYADLDGNLLITNDPFKSGTIHNGQLQLSEKNGLGIELKDEIIFREIK